MRVILFAAALSMGGIALAQDAGSQGPATSTETTEQPSGITTNDGTVPGDGVTQQGTDPNGAAVAPPGTNQPLVVPPGAVAVPPTTDQSAAFTPQAAAKEYPPCSKTVTDGCVQTYERGVRRNRARRR